MAEPLDLAIARERTRRSLLGTAAQPRRLGRYELGERIGEGGMGLVIAATDPLLRRRVAIKLVRTAGLGAAASTRFEHQLIREARALASISDPNVVPVFEIGRGRPNAAGDPTVYCVMELVAGVDARRWAEARVRPWPAILELLRAAGSGLAAAHRAGVIHCDFKPDNVLVADDGRVMVADFGLARGACQTGVASGVYAGLAGTLPYMSPQCLAGTEPSASDDQFAFCVAAYELLYGHRPFRGRTRLEIAARISEAEPEPPPSDTTVPQRIHRVLLRGLAKAADDRFADMQALLAALTQARRRPGSRGLGAMLAIVTIASVITLGPSSRPCDADARLATVWNPERASATHGSFSATAVPYAELTWTRVHRSLDLWSEQWRQAYAASCGELTRSRDDEDTSARLACLDDALQKLDRLLLALGHAEAGVVTEAERATARLPELARCAEPNRTAAADPSAIELAARAAMETTLDLAHLAVVFGQYDQARREVAAVLGDAHVEPLPQLRARALLIRGMAHAQQGDLRAAAEDLEGAYWGAHAGDDPVTAAEAANELAKVVHELDPDPDVAIAWTRHAWTEAIAGELGPDALAQIAGSQALIAFEAGRTLDATAWNALALGLAWADPSCASGCASATTLLGNAGTVFVELGYETEGLAMIEAALADELGRFGPDHPHVASTHAAIANVLIRRGQPAAARAHVERTVAIRERALDPAHRLTARSLNLLAIVQHELGEPTAAEASLRRALAILEVTPGDWIDDVAPIRVTLANLLLARGEAAEAAELLRRAIAELEPRGERLSLAAALNNLGTTMSALGDKAGAAQHFRRSAEMRERLSGPGDPELLWPLGNLATMSIDLGRPSAALPILDRAEALVSEETAEQRLPWLRFLRARALWDSGVERERARQLALDARTLADGDPTRLDLDQVDQWLATHR